MIGVCASCGREVTNKNLTKCCGNIVISKSDFIARYDIFVEHRIETDYKGYSHVVHIFKNKYGEELKII